MREILGREQAFLTKHPGWWIPAFAESVGRVGGAGFYPTLVAAANAFVHDDRELVRLLAAVELEEAAG